MKYFCVLLLAIVACASRPELVQPGVLSVAEMSNSVVGFGAYDGTIFSRHRDGDSLEYSAIPTIIFARKLNGVPTYTISASDGSIPPSQPYIGQGYGRYLALTTRIVPGIRYTIHVTSPSEYAVHFTSAARVDIPKPIRNVRDPYYYGVLEHPFPASLGHLVDCTSYACIGGSGKLAEDSQNQVNLICQSGVGYARIDYMAAQIENNGKKEFAKPNFTTEDAIVDALHTCNVTELPVILQYSGGPIWTGHKGNSSPMDTPAHYAKLVRDVVEHLKAKAPWVRAVELMNEPNNHGWGTFPIAGRYVDETATQTVDETGVSAAQYLLAGYAAAKTANPTLTVVAPALATGGHHFNSVKWMENLYANGCGLRKCFDEISVHNYRWQSPNVPTENAENAFDDYKPVQRVVQEHDHVKPNVWLTEWGFSHSVTPYGKDPRVQALYIAQGYNRALADRSVVSVVYVNIYNASCKPSCAADFWGRTAVTDPDPQSANGARLLPGYAVIQEFARSRELH